MIEKSPLRWPWERPPGCPRCHSRAARLLERVSGGLVWGCLRCQLCYGQAAGELFVVGDRVPKPKELVKPPEVDLRPDRDMEGL